MRINANLSALSAFNALSLTNKKLNKSLQELSTGLRINSASDDAAGFAISEKVRSQVQGLDTALRNTQDGMSLIQTAEGALGETNAMLSRMRELAVQASNDSLTANDRQHVQLEIDELKKQIDRIAGTTQFNRKRLLDGSSGASWSSSDAGLKARINGGLTYTDLFGQKVSSEGNYKLEVKAEAGEAQVQKSSIMGTYAEPEEITETVRAVSFTPVTETETQLVEKITTTSEIFSIYINGTSNANTSALDNLISLPAHATQESINAVNALRQGLSFENGVLTITADGTYNIVGRTSGSNTISTTNRIKVAAGVNANVFLTDVDINVTTISRACAFEVEPGATANVYLSGNNSLKSGMPRAGLEVTDGAVLTLSSADGDGRTTGTLTAIGGSGAFVGAGIGGPGDGGYSVSNGRAGDITINGGTITATGGTYAAGIGGGDTHGNDGGGHITINGGNITATGGNCAAGIGQGDGTEYYTIIDESITINGGNITARGGGRAAGIGGSNRISSGRITISSNATINASGYMADGINAIGSGMGSTTGANDSVTYTNDSPVLRPSVPDRLYLMAESRILAEEEVSVITNRLGFIDTSRTVKLTPPSGVENKLSNVNTYSNNGADSLTCKGLPSGSYNVSTMSLNPRLNPYRVTGSYGFDSDVSDMLVFTNGSGRLTTNASILFEVTGVNRAENKVTLKATANLMGTDGTTSKHMVFEGLTLEEGRFSALSGLNLSGDIDYDAENENPAVMLGLSTGTSRAFDVGNKFVCNLAPSGFAANECAVEISGTQDNDSLTLEPVVYNLDAGAVKDSTLTFSNFYLNSDDGTVCEGDISITTNGTTLEAGRELAAFEALSVDSETALFKIADETTPLNQVTNLYTSDGVFMLDPAKTITITQGNGETASITLYGYDTLSELQHKLNDAISSGLGQMRYTDADNFVSFVREDGTTPGDESVAGTFVIRSTIPGQAGELSFSGDEDLLNALGLNTIRESSETTYTASLYDAHSGKVIAHGLKTTGNVLSGAIPNVDIEFDPMAGITSRWDEDSKRYVLSEGETYSAFLHLMDETITFQIGANQGEDFTIYLGDASSRSLGVSSVSVATRETASRAIGTIDRAITQVSSQRAKLGAYTNALEHTMTNLTTTSTNLTATESRIRDADMSQAMMEFVKLQILNQSGTLMLAQANQLPQSVLNLVQ